MSDVTTNPDPLAPLAGFLAGQGLKTELTDKGLKVVNPKIAGCCSAHAADTITCRPRTDDGGRLWFFTSWGEPIAEPHHIADAALFIRANLARRELTGDPR
ncbi:hypothetical protein [Actinomadura rugatobispora]|uniref:Uncharacterized protein n=1 Tax=Actinomadura rugatobispora TaxID=1994 RepID=A0ABW1A1W4_9ACTN